VIGRGALALPHSAVDAKQLWSKIPIYSVHAKPPKWDPRPFISIVVQGSFLRLSMLSPVRNTETRVTMAQWSSPSKRHTPCHTLPFSTSSTTHTPLEKRLFVDVCTPVNNVPGSLSTSARVSISFLGSDPSGVAAKSGRQGDAEALSTQISICTSLVTQQLSCFMI
jgi:hypothetical protein